MRYWIEYRVVTVPWPEVEETLNVLGQERWEVDYFGEATPQAQPNASARSTAAYIVLSRPRFAWRGGVRKA